MSIRWPRVLTPTYLSQILQLQKNPLKALQIFREAQSKYSKYHHNGSVYGTMISILGKSGQITEMKDVIEQMRKDSCECKDSVFVSAIKTYAEARMIDEAISLYQSIPRFNCINWTESFNTLLKVLVKENRLEASHHLFRESSYGWQVKSRIQSLNLLMEVLCEKNRSDLALHIFQEMDYQGCYPDRDSYAILMKGLCHDGRLHEAKHLLYSMFWRISQKGSSEDIVVYRTLLDALCDNGQIEEATEILGKILRKGLKAPKRCCYRLDLTRCDDGEDIEAMKRMIHEALFKGTIPSLASYSAMSIDLYKDGKIVEADKVITEMQDRGYKPTHPIFEAKVEALCKETKIDEAIKVIEEDMVKANCLPTAIVYNIVLKSLCNEGQSILALEYLNKVSKKSGCKVDKESYSIVLEMLCRERRYIEASQLLEKMSIKSYWPCAYTYNSLIGGLCSLGSQYEAVMWLEEMISQDMAIVRQRRQLNLCLALPDPSDRCCLFPHPATSSSTVSSSVADISLNDIEKLEVLGHGNGGTVYKVRHKRTSALHALKIVHSSSDPITCRQVRREMDILRRTDSPYVVQFHGFFEKPSGDVAILLEYMDLGTLDTLLKNNGTFSESQLTTVARQVLNGLSYLHANKIIHRDIKPSNLLVNRNMEVKISDFGVSKVMSRTLDACNSYVGTCAYMSPERFDPDRYGGNYNGYAADIWSLGLTLFELYVGHFPFLPAGQRPDWATLMCSICFGDPPTLPESASDVFQSFMECCLKKESSERWTASQLLTHPFLCKQEPELLPIIRVSGIRSF